jgi:hypothetical protein
MRRELYMMRAYMGWLVHKLTNTKVVAYTPMETTS